MLLTRILMPSVSVRTLCASAIFFAASAGAFAQSQTPQAAPPPALPPAAVTITCSSTPNTRQDCPSDTSRGVVLVRSYGQSACLLGKTWGYDDKGVWVSDGCVADFLVRATTAVAAEAPRKKTPRYVPNGGFLLFDGDEGQMYARLFTYVRYLNQLGLNDTYTDGFGNVKSVQRRQDFQLQKFFLPFNGWFLTPKLRYYLYVWSSNASQGDPAQVVGGGNISYVFNRYVTLGGGITSLPSVRSTEGQFPDLARRRRPAHRRRVLPRVVHHGDVAQGRVQDEVQVHGDAREQPEHARRQRVADGQHARHAVVHAAVAADDGRVWPLRHVWRLRLPRQAGDAPGDPLHVEHRGQAEPARRRRHREQPDSPHRRQRDLHAQSVRRRHHREQGQVPDVEPGRRSRSTKGCLSRPSTTGAG